MKRSLRFVGLAAFVALPALVSAQDAPRPVSFGISGGLSLPSGDLADGLNSGFNVTGHIMLRPASFTNLSFRGDVNFDRFGAKDVGGVSGEDFNFRFLGGTANAVYAFPQSTPGMVRPYVLIGAGMQNFKGTESTGASESSNSVTKPHVQAGGGVNFQLSGFTTFIEAKYVNVFTEGSSSAFIPITFGIRF
jgi:hypothetical protein